jgi:two-component system cell cycle response regulator DivK
MTKRIVVIEDHEDNRAILRDLLTSAGYDILEAGDGREGIALVAAERPDLVLMDIQLPVMDGYAATRAIKGDSELASIPIVAVTSFALNGDASKAQAAGCDAYIAKPYRPRELLAKVREILGDAP